MEITTENLIGKEFPQSCGDSLKVLGKTSAKSGTNYYYECQFSKYPNDTILALKKSIVSGSVF